VEERKRIVHFIFSAKLPRSIVEIEIDTKDMEESVRDVFKT